MAGEYIEFNNLTQPAINDTNLNLMQQMIKQDIQGAVSGDTLPVGAIMPFGSDTIPENWLLCDGSAVSRTTYQDLFNTIGTSYGQGDGFTTFNLPDLRGRVGVGKSSDTEFDTLGETGGEKTHTLTIDEMPSHNHKVERTADAHNLIYQSGDIPFNDGTASSASPATTTNTGGGQPHSILQPYIVTNYIIKAYQSAGVVATVVDNLNSTSSTDALSANQGKVLDAKIDGIIESGSNYIKWADGTLICKYKKDITTEINTTWGGLYISSDITLDNYAVPFIETPVLSIFVDGINSAIIMNAGYGSVTAPPKINLCRGPAGSSTSYTIHVFAIGKWK